MGISLDILTRQQTVDRRAVVRFQTLAIRFYLLQRVQTDSGFLSASYENVTGNSFTVGKVDVASNCHSTPSSVEVKNVCSLLPSTHMPNSMMIN